ncbi:MAG: GspH/FimT family pseudopilin [Gammaproteobacteria bacterium]|nr:GspH/FimT family pseudopilin [Pseudomonadales bacterium]MCP5345680.1 GspH/FimT family pseudopilin [Pseudomonadales bacterium]
MNPAHHETGISLLESLIAIFILTILTQIGLPDLTQILRHRQGSLVLQSLANSIYLARTAAARWKTMTMLCPTTDGLHCDGQWHDGVLVYVDWNDNQLPDGSDEIIDYLKYEKLSGTLRWRAFRSKPFLQITPLGFTRYQNGSFTWCDNSGVPQNAHQLILNRTGRVRFAKDLDGDGVRENSRGSPIDCPN